MAAVCTMTTVAMMRLSGTRCCQLADRNVGDRKRRQRAGNSTENRDASAFKSEQHHCRGRRNEPDQRAGNACVDPFRHGDDRQDAEADDRA